MTELDCGFCPDPILPGQNHTTNPPAHIHCAHTSGLLGIDDPVLAGAEARQLRSWLTGHADGNAVTGGWYEPAAVTAEQPDRMVWDDPATGRMPWVEVALVPCPGQPYLDAIDGWNGSYQCGRKHYHRSAVRIRPITTTAEVS